MGNHSHAHQDKVKVTIECTADERAYTESGLKIGFMAVRKPRA